MKLFHSEPCVPSFSAICRRPKAIFATSIANIKSYKITRPRGCSKPALGVMAYDTRSKICIKLSHSERCVPSFSAICRRPRAIFATSIANIKSYKIARPRGCSKPALGVIAYHTRSKICIKLSYIELCVPSFPAICGQRSDGFIILEIVVDRL